jgi:hypothetical protein
MLEQITDEIRGPGRWSRATRPSPKSWSMGRSRSHRALVLEMTNVTFQNDEHVMKIIQRIIAPSAVASTSRARWSTPAWPMAPA